MSTNCDQMASKPSSNYSSSPPKHHCFFLYAFILSLSLVLLVSSFNSNPVNVNAAVNIRRQKQPVVKNNQTINAVDVLIRAVAKQFKDRRKLKLALVNIDDHDNQTRKVLHGLNDVVEAVHVRFDRVAADQKWEEFFPKWIDEDERYGRPKCPEIPMPEFENFKNIDVVLARVPPCGGDDKKGIRDLFRLQVNLVVANLAARGGWVAPDLGVPHRTVYVVFMGSCGPMVEIFRCDDLVKRLGEFWVYKPEIGRLKQKVLMPFGSCQLASGYARAGKEYWRPYNRLYPPRYAYVTVLHSSEDYVCGAIALAQSIRNTNSKRDLVLLADDSITNKSIAGLQAAGWDVRRIQRIRSIFAQKGSYNEWNYSKLRVWQLTEYSKVIFIDADFLVLRNMDAYFTYPELSAAANHKDLFNSGLMIIEPSLCMFEYLMRKSLKVEPYNGGDQGFLDEIFTWWHRLSWRLNALKTFEGKSNDEHNVPMAEELYAVHYLGLKPWMCYKDYDCNWDVESRRVFASDSAHRWWWQMYEAMPVELQRYCGLTEEMDLRLKKRRASAANASFVDGHWKIEIKDPRQHHISIR